MNTSNYTPTGIELEALAIWTAYKKDPDAEFIIIKNSVLDPVIEYFKNNEVCPYYDDLVMDVQLKFKGKPIIAYA